jgi:DNA repair protein RadC
MSDMFNQKESDMVDVSTCTTLELLTLLLGEGEAREIYPAPLDQLFNGNLPNQNVALKLSATRELVARYLKEEMKKGLAMSTPQMVRDYLRLLLRGEEREIFLVIFLDGQHRLIAAEKLFYGTLGQAAIYPREVVKRALVHNAGTVIFAHNHPSGIAEPSQADQKLTESLTRALALIDVKVLDHFVVGDSQTTSFVERGLL